MARKAKWNELAVTIVQSFCVQTIYRLNYCFNKNTIYPRGPGFNVRHIPSSGLLSDVDDDVNTWHWKYAWCFVRGRTRGSPQCHINFIISFVISIDSMLIIVIGVKYALQQCRICRPIEMFLYHWSSGLALSLSETRQQECLSLGWSSMRVVPSRAFVMKWAWFYLETVQGN